MRNEEAMRSRKFVLFGLLISLLFVATSVQAQPGEFVVKRLKEYWQDQNKQPWNDLSYKMAIRIDPQYAQELGTDEISSNDNPPVKYTTGWQFFSLQKDSKGTYAEVSYLVYKDSSKQVVYQIELQKNGKAPPFVSGAVSKKSVSNDSVQGPPIALNQQNAIFWQDWLMIAGLLLVSALIIYVLVFRWLFGGLLFRRRWNVGTAEHFTWSMSLLLLLAVVTATAWFKLGPRLETFLLIGIIGAFWLLHVIVWMVSGKEA
jgi:hypothetical protein